jgi:hypothetical protein
MDTSSILHFSGVDPISVGWAAGLTTLVIFGTVLTLLEGRFLRNNEQQIMPTPTPTYNLGRSNILRIRLLVFVFSCGWEIVRQGIWHNFPDVYE